MAFHKDRVTFSRVITHAPLSPRPSLGDAFPVHRGGKVSGKNCAGTPSLSSRDVFIKEERAGRLALSTEIHITEPIIGQGERWGMGTRGQIISLSSPDTHEGNGGDGQTDVWLSK